MTGTTLGCGAYDVVAQPRGGGGSILGIVPWTAITWERVLDDTSSARVTLDLADPRCCTLMRDLRPWRHELSVRRDGAEVWVGPLTIATEPSQQRDLPARDITAWWDHRRIYNDHTYREVDIATVFEEVSADAMAPDNSPGLVVAVTPTGIRTSVVYLSAQHLVAGATLRDLANIGVDWTAIADPIGTLSDGHFLNPPQPTLDGSQQANAIVVRGAGGGAAGDTVFGYDADTESIALDGLLEDVVSVPTITDNPTAVALQKVVALIGDAVLAPGAPITVDRLIPGAVATVILSETCIPVAGNYRLQKVSAAISSSDNIEQITLSFQPVGTE